MAPVAFTSDDENKENEVPGKGLQTNLSSTPRSKSKAETIKAIGQACASGSFSVAELFESHNDHEVLPPPRSTPREQIGWASGSNDSSQQPSTPLVSKSVKRNRSTSSPAAPRIASLTLAGQPQSGETPFANSAEEVWAQYSRLADITPCKAPASANPEVTRSSPRSQTHTPFRRWESDGARHLKKRRKVELEKSTLIITPTNKPRVSSAKRNVDVGTPTKELANLHERTRYLLEKLREPIKEPDASLSQAQSIVDDNEREREPMLQHDSIKEDEEETIILEGLISSSAPAAVLDTKADEFGLDDEDTELALQSWNEESQCKLTTIPEDHKTAPIDEFDNFEDGDFEELAATLDNAESDLSKEPIPQHSANVPVPQIPVDSDAQSKGGPTNAIEIEDDEFDDGTFGDFLADIEASQCKGNAEKPDEKKTTIQRYIVMSIHQSEWQDDRGFQQEEKLVHIEDEKTKSPKIVILRQTWLDTPCTKGSYVHIIAHFDRTGQCIIDNSSGIIILHPDHLISATVVADSFSCTRRAVLQDRVKATNDANAAQVYGHVLHEIFQEALRANCWEIDVLKKIVKEVAERYLEAFYEIGIGLNQAMEHLLGKMSELQGWAMRFVKERPDSESIVKDRNGTTALLSVNRLLDVEEHVWSPMYGLKGNIDATVQVSYEDASTTRTLTVPFELKTGRNTSNASHKAQTALYTLLLSDRYDVSVVFGVLYYMETSEMYKIEGVRHELMHMIKQRNELACYVRQRLELPPMLKSQHLCGKCYAQSTCFIYHKLIDNGTGESSGLKEKFEKITKHLTGKHQEFFKKWDDLLTREETDMLKFRRELWTMLSHEREKVGRCFGQLVIQADSAKVSKDQPKINRFEYTLERSPGADRVTFTESQITLGEPIVVSDEDGHYALANGYVTAIRRHSVRIAVDRQLDVSRAKGPDFDEQNNQCFHGVHSQSTAHLPPKLYRLDKDEFSNGMAIARSNLIKLMDQDVYGSLKLRQLVVDGRKPDFKPESDVRLPPALTQANLNNDQQQAIRKILTAKDYALVLGMPGTGKTTTIAHIIRTLAAQGKSILLASYTNTAVDNILLKIKDDKFDVFRIGTFAKVHPEVRDFAMLSCTPKTTVEEIKRAYESQIVATTCLSIGHAVFSQRVFDYCIVDEASQITLPTCLGPIRMANTFVLVGDHYQLPPLVQNKEAREGGLDISLFKLLSDTQPDSVVNLEHQYRMCADIMLLSNTLIYSGRLKCGTSAVATRRLEYPNSNGLQVHHHTGSVLKSSQSRNCHGVTADSCWLRTVLDPARQVVFIDADGMLPQSRETAKGPRITNIIEAQATTQLVQALLSLGVDASEIGVIALYRSQLAVLRQCMKQNSTSTFPGAAAAAQSVEMHTADKFQGRDKEAIILNLVRSNEACNVGDLLKDERRVNVALTRARTKLIILGSWSTISKGSTLLGKMCQIIDEKSWKVDMQSHWLEDHVFATNATTMTYDTDAQVKAGRHSPSPRKPLLPRSSNPRSTPPKARTASPWLIAKRRAVLNDVLNEAMS